MYNPSLIILQASGSSGTGMTVLLIVLAGIIIFFIIRSKRRAASSLPEKNIVEVAKLHCAKCGSENIKVLKKGFNIGSAILGLLAIGLILGILWWVLSQQADFIYFKNSAAFQAATICLPILGLLFGAVDMNVLEANCLNCGNKKAI